MSNCTYPQRRFNYPYAFIITALQSFDALVAYSARKYILMFDIKHEHANERYEDCKICDVLEDI